VVICGHMGRTFKSRCEIGVDAPKFGSKIALLE